MCLEDDLKVTVNAVAWVIAGGRGLILLGCCFSRCTGCWLISRPIPDMDLTFNSLSYKYLRNSLLLYKLAHSLWSLETALLDMPSLRDKGRWHRGMGLFRSGTYIMYFAPLWFKNRSFFGSFLAKSKHYFFSKPYDLAYDFARHLWVLL